MVDLIHVLEYLWKAAYVFSPEGSKDAEDWVTERLLWLLCGDVGQVIASVRRTATLRGLRRRDELPIRAPITWSSLLRQVCYSR